LNFNNFIDERKKMEEEWLEFTGEKIDEVGNTVNLRATL